MLPVSRNGVRLELLPDKAAWAPDLAALVIADWHLGKPAAFRAGGAPVPEAVTAADLARIDALLDQTAAPHLVVLGDLLHAAAGVTDVVIDAVADWRRTRPDLAITNIRGNHDRAAGDPPAPWRIDVRTVCTLAGIGLAHEPQDAPGAKLTLCGHLHPAAKLRAQGRRRTLGRLPCFWATADRLIFPAFGGFTGMACVTPRQGDAVYALSPQQPGEPARVFDATALARPLPRNRQRMSAT